MIRHIASLVAGLLFGLGLAVSGMTHASKVLGFLDIAGDWDPSLLFVFGGAVGMTVITFRFILRRKAPLFADRFHLSSVRDIHRTLVVGSVIFGIGWGISGYCPGPAVALLASPNWETWVFFPSMVLGSMLQKGLAARQRATEAPAENAF